MINDVIVNYSWDVSLEQKEAINQLVLKAVDKKFIIQEEPGRGCCVEPAELFTAHNTVVAISSFIFIKLSSGFLEELGKDLYKEIVKKIFFKKNKNKSNIILETSIDDLKLSYIFF